MTINNHGIFVDSRHAYGCVIRLYAIQDFFIEVWSSKLLPWDNVVHISTFKEFSPLNPYLERIDFKALLPQESLQG